MPRRLRSCRVFNLLFKVTLRRSGLGEVGRRPAPEAGDGRRAAAQVTGGGRPLLHHRPRPPPQTDRQAVALTSRRPRVPPPECGARPPVGVFVQ